MFQLPAEITIAKAEAFKSALLTYIENQEHIVIDDTSVEKIDTIGVQLLLAMVTYLASINKTIEWQCASTLIKESITKLGISDPILMQYIDA